MKQSYFRQIVEAVIIGPLIETFIFQKGLYYLLSNSTVLKQRKIVIMVIGAIIFGLLHFYSLSYVIFNIFTGFLFMFAYIIKLYKNPYWFVVILHGLMNLFAIFIDPVEKLIFGAI
jgi:membrane protease YdiL (CAAX protease family)